MIYRNIDNTSYIVEKKITHISTERKKNHNKIEVICNLGCL